MSYFDNVAGVIFVTALNHYNAVLFEDEEKNAMHEAVKLFEQFANIHAFEKAGVQIFDFFLIFFFFVPVAFQMILFLNKNDLFMQQLKIVPLNVCFDKDAGWLVFLLVVFVFVCSIYVFYVYTPAYLLNVQYAKTRIFFFFFFLHIITTLPFAHTLLKLLSSYDK
ncbi:G Protein, Alpha subunit family member (gpa-2) [Reticulomyxa filosa]|uniref:G Protein, Alpha subunit family member (Gpa-2) n=1 Tax=Reticulomyxa filosa TaxID=46433 RepID=X6NSJ7_RETFI|nr:G Protein, Alpha subunit family member (gpa-2) [Reticulomyxa filosa]|eukprot:ETO29270.1 G Protein, Alpha subunit family member (gpa-2) [Reticulomyxa filosa]